MVNYTESVNISKFEFEVIKHLRDLSNRGYGELHLTYVDGKCVNLKPTFTEAREKLLLLQK